jgi:hypothetical protein
MIEKLIWIEAIIQRPAITLLTSRFARRSDSPSKRSASSQHPGDGERLLHERRDVGHRPLPVAGDPAADVPDPAGEEDEERDEREREDGEAPVEEEHRHDRRDHRRHVGDDRGGGRGDDAFDAAYVVRDPRLHLACPGACEEGKRESLQVPVDPRAEVVHDALADLVREPGLIDAEHAREDGDPDQAENEDREQRVVVLRQRLVEDVAHEERRDDAQERREPDEAEDDAQAPAIRPEEPEHAAQVVAPHGRVGRPLRCIVGAETRPHEPTLAARSGLTGSR